MTNKPTTLDVLNTQLRTEVCQGRVAQVERYLKMFPQWKPELPKLFRSAIVNSKYAVLDCLIAHCTVDERNLGLKAALDYRRFDLIERLIPISRPKTERSIILTNAVQSQSLDAVKILLPHCNPLADDSRALQECCCIFETDLRDQMIDILYPVSNPGTALKHLRPKSTAWSLLHERLERERIHKLLSAETQNCAALPKPRKM